MTTWAALRMGARSFSHSSPYSVELSLHEAGAGLRPLGQGFCSQGAWRGPWGRHRGGRGCPPRVMEGPTTTQNMRTLAQLSFLVRTSQQRWP